MLLGRPAEYSDDAPLLSPEMEFLRAADADLAALADADDDGLDVDVGLDDRERLPLPLLESGPMPWFTPWPARAWYDAILGASHNTNEPRGAARHCDGVGVGGPHKTPALRPARPGRHATLHLTLQSTTSDKASKPASNLRLKYSPSPSPPDQVLG